MLPCFVWEVFDLPSLFKDIACQNEADWSLVFALDKADKATVVNHAKVEVELAIVHLVGFDPHCTVVELEELLIDFDSGLVDLT